MRQSLLPHELEGLTCSFERAHPQLTIAPGVIAGHHTSAGSGRVDPRPDVEGHHGNLPADEDPDHDRRPEPSLVGRSDEDLIAELLLDREGRVRPVSSEHRMELDLVATEDIHIHIGGRGIEHHWPSEHGTKPSRGGAVTIIGAWYFLTLTRNLLTTISAVQQRMIDQKVSNGKKAT